MVLADQLSGLTAIHRGMEFVGRDFPNLVILR